MTRKEWLIAVIFTFITIIAWVAFDIIHTSSQVEIPTDIQQLIEPLNPNLDTSVLDSTP
ncbi:hypothetical protein HYT18_03730 [Candidatus Microgenomates bacterium]|nr:hypothetical protein [Candidatus Microgenomates bacterium]